MVVGNWKLNGNIAFVMKYLRVLLADFPELPDLTNPNSQVSQLVLCPPVILLGELRMALQQLALEFSHASSIQCGAQDVSQFGVGSFTGEVSAEQLVDQGCRFVIIGHSERRQYHQETNEIIKKKIRRALSVGIKPILCVGETLVQRERNQTFEVLSEQLAVIDSTEDVMLAYEPVWAIGTGSAATIEQVVEVHQWIINFFARNQVKSVAVLYGGSVKPDNAPQLFAQSSVSGVLVGGCSLDPNALAKIYQAAVQASLN